MKKLIALIALLFVQNAFSETSILYAPQAGHFGVTHHCGELLNEKIDMIGINVNNYTFTTFNNSLSQQTFTASRKFKYTVNEFSIGLHAGVIYGYSLDYFRDCDGDKSADLLPFLAPSFSFEFKNIGVELLILGNAYTIAGSVKL